MSRVCTKPANALVPGDRTWQGHEIIGVFDATDRNGRLMPGWLRIVIRCHLDEVMTWTRVVVCPRTEHFALETP